LKEKLRKKENEIEYEILEGVDGVDLLRYIVEDQTKNSLKCIFTDESMEFMNGSEAIKIVRKMENENKIKNYFIVSVSGYEDLQSKHILESAGANLVEKKPLMKSSMKEILEKIGVI